MLVSERGTYYLYVSLEERYNSSVKQGTLMRLNKPNNRTSKTVFKKEETIKYKLYYEEMKYRWTDIKQ